MSVKDAKARRMAPLGTPTNLTSNATQDISLPPRLEAQSACPAYLAGGNGARNRRVAHEQVFQAFGQSREALRRDRFWMDQDTRLDR
jgi:hypothetical protein